MYTGAYTGSKNYAYSITSHIMATMRHYNEVDSPNRSTVVLAIGGRLSPDLKLPGHSQNPPNMVTSIRLGPRLIASLLCEHLEWSLGSRTCM